ncbi:MAG: hypothetical protein PHG83_02595 [Patescibacteria group bacterium]|jgi:hypothetical protein|nr:hypothetical protein [Patescibacteria group bacterium]
MKRIIGGLKERNLSSVHKRETRKILEFLTIPELIIYANHLNEHGGKSNLEKLQLRRAITSLQEADVNDIAIKFKFLKIKFALDALSDIKYIANSISSGIFRKAKKRGYIDKKNIF